MFEHDYPSANDVSDRLATAIRHIEFARNYMLTLLEDLSDDDWFWTPENFPTHIAWQVGHIAMSEYGLTLFQQRGRNREVDAELMSSKFRKLFMRGTKPSLERDTHPQPEEILTVLNRVHEQMRLEVPTFDGPALDEPLGPPTSAYATRYGALLFTGDHEMLHAGQIGLLRRLMGKPPLR
ncbi:MAG: DinB family protein [Planctomycetota bacterium]